MLEVYFLTMEDFKKAEEDHPEIQNMTYFIGDIILKGWIAKSPDLLISKELYDKWESNLHVGHRIYCNIIGNKAFYRELSASGMSIKDNCINFMILEELNKEVLK
jgi:hypothetical protein